jgi:tRNA pseudouridine55 synthase
MARVDGFVVVDKPGGMTSHDVVARMRRLARTRRVGHAGTLDPMATGVLVIGIGRATRLLSYASSHRKAYQGTVRLGQTTITDDAEGEVTGRRDAADLSEAQIAAALGAFRGEISQVPSAVSAIKVKGIRSYARVRRGEEVALPARPVTVHRLECIAVRPEPPIVDVDIEIDCSAGTYVRAVARDLGEQLGVGGHLVALRRTAIGDVGGAGEPDIRPFTLADAVPLEELLAAGTPPAVIALSEVATRLLPRRDVDAELARVLSHGGPLPAQGRPGPYAVFGPDGLVVAVVAERDGRARAEVVLSPAGGSGEEE